MLASTLSRPRWGMPTTTSSRPCSVTVSQPQGGAQFYGDAEAQALSEWEYEAHHDPDYLLEEPDAEQRWAMVLHNEYPSNRAQVALTPVGKLRDDDNVVLFVPRNRDVYRYIKGVKSGAALPPKHAPVAAEAREPVTPYPAVHVPTAFDQWPESRRWPSSKVNMSALTMI
jgi:hypothetical protein